MFEMFCIFMAAKNRSVTLQTPLLALISEHFHWSSNLRLEKSIFHMIFIQFFIILIKLKFMNIICKNLIKLAFIKWISSVSNNIYFSIWHPLYVLSTAIQACQAPIFYIKPALQITSYRNHLEEYHQEKRSECEMCCKKFFLSGH